MRILILAHGDAPSEELFRSFHRSCDLFIAADGGANTALGLGIVPDIITGDMDSFNVQKDLQSLVIHDPDQETNDLEKALSLAKKNNARRVDILGATGKRLDHSLKNLSVLLRFNPFFEHLTFYDDAFSTRIIPKDFNATLPVGHTVSLFPLSGRVSGITTHGLTFPLKNEHLENGVRDGTSNEVSEPSIRITHESGALVFMTRLTTKDFE
ncbi:thiamine diphosphokinase [Balneolaceae bacterium ANBcel3]|nr:thiamine diphosphokinase [Balneolaceae bacterium ANBcel3]